MEMTCLMTERMIDGFGFIKISYIRAAWDAVFFGSEFNHLSGLLAMKSSSRSHAQRFNVEDTCCASKKE